LERLAQALEANGSATLAARLRRAREARVEGDRMVVVFAGAPAATVEAVGNALPELAAAARAVGLPARVAVENGDSGTVEGAGQGGLRGQVEQDPAVQRVLEVFGGRIDRVKERT